MNWPYRMSREVVEREMKLSDEGDRPPFTFINEDYSSAILPMSIYKDFLANDNEKQSDSLLRVILNESWRCIGVFNAKVWTSKMNAHKKVQPKKSVPQVSIDGNLYCLKRLQWFTRQYKRVADEMIVFKMNQNKGRDVPILIYIEGEAVFVIAPRVFPEGEDSKYNEALVLLKGKDEEDIEEIPEEEKELIEDVVEHIIDYSDITIDDDDEPIVFNPITGEFE